MGGIKWTDNDLRDAVADARSWRQVLRTLGLNDGSGGSIQVVKRHSERLGLDASHFSGTRRWSDRQLSKTISEANSWSEVLTSLGLVDDRRTEIRIKGTAVRLGLDVDHLEPNDPEPVDLFTSAPEMSQLRIAAPSIVAAWFALQGAVVALPLEPQEYDLLVTTPDGTRRVQVKSSTATRDGTWIVGVGRRPYSLEKTAGKIPYDPDKLDLFAIVNGDGEIYLIPSMAVAGRTGICLRAYEQYKVGDASGLLN